MFPTGGIRGHRGASGGAKVMADLPGPQDSVTHLCTQECSESALSRCSQAFLNLGPPSRRNQATLICDFYRSLRLAIEHDFALSRSATSQRPASTNVLLFLSFPDVSLPPECFMSAGIRLGSTDIWSGKSEVIFLDFMSKHEEVSKS